MKNVTSYKLQVTRYKLNFLNLKSLNFKFFCFSAFLLFCSSALFAQQSDTTTLNLLNPTYPTVFNFTSNGYWDKTFNDVEYPFFKSQIFSFSHLIEGPGSAYGGGAWNGFTVCNSGDNTDYSYTGNWFNYQWGCMAGGGITTDAQGNILKDENGDVKVQKGIPYLVGYWNFIIEPEWWHLGWGNTFIDEPTRCLQILLDNDEEYEAVGVYVNTHPYSYYAILHGFGLARPFNQQGDYFKLIFHGINKDGTKSGKYVEHCLAKYENSQLIQSTKWEWVDLSSLGEIGGIYCMMASTDTSIYGYGPNTPVIFCMDKLQVRTKETPISYIITATVNNPDFGTINPIGEVIVEQGGSVTFFITAYNNHTVNDVIVNGASQGKIVTYTFENVQKNGTIDVLFGKVGVVEMIHNKIQIYSHQNSVYTKNESNNEYLSVKIFDLSGRLVYQGTINDNETIITLQVVHGIYNVVLYARDAMHSLTTKILIMSY